MAEGGESCLTEQVGQQASMGKVAAALRLTDPDRPGRRMVRVMLKPVSAVRRRWWSYVTQQTDGHESANE